MSARDAAVDASDVIAEQGKIIAELTRSLAIERVRLNQVDNAQTVTPISEGSDGGLPGN